MKTIKADWPKQDAGQALLNAHKLANKTDEPVRLRIGRYVMTVNPGANYIQSVILFYKKQQKTVWARLKRKYGGSLAKGIVSEILQYRLSQNVARITGDELDIVLAALP